MIYLLSQRVYSFFEKDIFCHSRVGGNPAVMHLGSNLCAISAICGALGVISMYEPDEVDQDFAVALLDPEP